MSPFDDIVIYRRGHAHAGRWQQAFEAGLRRHGVTFEVRDQRNPRPCGLAVLWGHRQERIHAMSRDYLTLETPFIGDGLTWCAMGFNGLNGRADFRNRGMPPDRWDRYFSHLMRPWQTGDCVVVMMQVPGDAAHARVDFGAWAAAAFRRASEQRMPVYVRHHPNGRFPGAWPELAGTLAEVLDRAAWVVTLNTTAAVDAVLAGVPAVAMDEGSMAWPVTGRDPATPPPMLDRRQWAADLAYTQWTMEETASGEAWEHLTRDGD